MGILLHVGSILRFGINGIFHLRVQTWIEFGSIVVVLRERVIIKSSTRGVLRFINFLIYGATLIIGRVIFFKEDTLNLGFPLYFTQPFDR